MHQQEREHLATLTALAGEYKVQASALTPLAHMLSYLLGIQVPLDLPPNTDPDLCSKGVATAMMGREAAMTCTEAVETVVAEHYNR